MENDDWDTGTLLEMFSRDSYFKQFCLAHLFTHIAFDNGVLGLAYIAGSRPYSVGGICSPHYYKGGFQLFLNTGWSSSLSRGHHSLLSQEATLVTAHEFGHNWGSEHDPDSQECSPSSSSGGKYVMYTYSVSGMDANNKVFSPCSQRSIGAVLQSKANACFKQGSSGFCGNWRVEDREQCDAGPHDTCCDSSCKLKSSAMCSDANDVCCRNCTFASSSVVCDPRQVSVCRADSHCTARSKDCPESPHLPNDTECISNGRGFCRSGRCLSLCEYHGMKSCICGTVEQSCQWCCIQSTANGTPVCAPFGGKNLTAGVPCLQGYCTDTGVCKKRIQDSVPRLWDIIEDVSVSSFVMFMRANIVGTVIVLSLILWIPICITISVIDYKAEKKYKDELDWALGKNKHEGQFIDETSAVKIVQAGQGETHL